MQLTADDARSLLAWYATCRTPKLHCTLADHGGGEGSAILLTVAAVISRTPPAYRLNGSSILAQWADVVELEATLDDELGSVRHLESKLQARPAGERVKVRAPLKSCQRRLKELDHKLGVVREHVAGLERDRRVSFDDALDWMAYDLTRRLKGADERELALWVVRLQGRIAG